MPSLYAQNVFDSRVSSVKPKSIFALTRIVLIVQGHLCKTVI